MADEDEAPVAEIAEAFQRSVDVFGAVLELFVSRAAEIEEIGAGAVDPVVTAGVDDKTMSALLRERLSESGQRRQIKIHGDAMHEQQSKIGVAMARREQQAVQRFVVAGGEIEKPRFDRHCGVSLPLTSPSRMFSVLRPLIWPNYKILRALLQNRQASFGVPAPSSHCES